MDIATNITGTPPQPRFASIVGRGGWWHRAWFRKDGTPRSKRKGAVYVLLASPVLIPIAVLVYMLALCEERRSLAWSLAQCYRTNTRYGKMDWDDFDSVADYYRDLATMYMVHEYKMTQDEVKAIFDDLKVRYKHDPAPSAAFPVTRIEITKLYFTRAAHRVNRYLLIITNDQKFKFKVKVELNDILDHTKHKDLGLLAAGKLVWLTLAIEETEWAHTIQLLDGVGKRLVLLRVERDKANHAVDWDTVD
ncbi:hypothetical protein CPB85DRAFT_1442722 [Mucidula mucida]|nr:hypothetical protein CPB85DRAFT_1442722 [Mucidula mucida]